MTAIVFSNLSIIFQQCILTLEYTLYYIEQNDFPIILTNRLLLQAHANEPVAGYKIYFLIN